MAFLQDEMGMTRRKAALVLGMVIFACCQPIIFLLKFGFMDEFDFWSGTFGLVVFCFLEVMLFAWVFGMDKAWKEIHLGADIRLPGMFYYIIKYVTPLFLGVLLVTWFVQSAWGILLLRNDQSGAPVPDGYGVFRLGARGLMVVLFAGLAVLVWRAWRTRRKKHVGA
jgi:hypothetical protein